MVRNRIHPAIFLVAFLGFFILEVAVALSTDWSWEIFYRVKIMLSLLHILGLPLTLYVIFRCLSKEETIWDKAFWSGFIVMTQFVGALFYLFSRSPNRDRESPTEASNIQHPVC